MKKASFRAHHIAALALLAAGATLVLNLIACSSNVTCSYDGDKSGSVANFNWLQCSDNTDRHVVCEKAADAATYACTCITAGASGNTFDGGADPYELYPMIPLPPATQAQVITSYDFIDAQCGWKLRPLGM